MKKNIILFLAVFLFSGLFAYAGLSQQVVDYRIKARLNPDKKGVTGEETLSWLNTSNFPASELHFHLYLNAFKNNRSTFMKESGGLHRSFKLNETEWGYIDIKKIQIKDGPDLLPNMEYIQPDDENEEDRTVMRITLPEPIPPGKKLILEIDFFSKLPKVFARSGFGGNFYMVAQWFPKIGVLEEDGNWNCHQYHAHSEFFANFGTYEVEITVPREYIVGATGKRTSRIENEDGTITYVHYQEDIHDFAWTACPDFVEFRETFVMEKPQVETEIILLIHQHHLKHKDRFLESLKNGIEFYSCNYGPYPYPTITLVDPPLIAAGAGGMEYPTLFTSMTASFIPRGLLLPEIVTIHEFGHNYWYGIVASNEFEEPWLDEGINSYSEAKAMAKYYGEESSMINLGWFKVSDVLLQRVQVALSSKLDPILKKSWEFYSGGSYSINSYQKASLTLLTLEQFLREGIMARIMRTYYERWKFRHPTTNDFIEIAEEVSGRDLGWFFQQYFISPGKLDYAVGSISSNEVKPPQGYFNGEMIGEREANKKNADRETGVKTINEEESKNEKMYRSQVTIVRKGELFFPQEILITFENGDEILEKWDGRERWQKFVYLKPYKLKSVRIDPEEKMVLDVNRLNNQRVLKPKKSFSLKAGLSCLLYFQNLLAFISF